MDLKPWPELGIGGHGISSLDLATGRLLMNLKMTSAFFVFWFFSSEAFLLAIKIAMLLLGFVFSPIGFPKPACMCNWLFEPKFNI